MTLSVVFRRAAELELETTARWYEQRRPGLGTEFLAEIDRVVRLAAGRPYRYPVIHKDIRRVGARRFPYFVFYRVETDRIVVLAVFHARRDPMVWRQRT